MKCTKCEVKLVELEALNAYIVDFEIKDESSVEHLTHDPAYVHLNSGVVHGEVMKSYYCPQCKKMIMELDEQFAG